MLYNVRYEIAVSEMMENNLGEIEYAILGEFHKFDKEGTGEIFIKDCEKALQMCKKLNLTPF